MYLTFEVIPFRSPTPELEESKNFVDIFDIWFCSSNRSCAIKLRLSPFSIKK